MAEKNFCSNCGTQINENTKICGNCGRLISNQEQTEIKDMKEIIDGIKVGDEYAFNRFYEMTNKKAFSVAIQMLKKEDVALDIIQDAYIKACNKIDTVDNPEKLVSWFYMLVANACRDYLKKLKPVLFNELDSEEFEFESSLENENEDFIPEAMIDYSETKRLMQNILDNLSPEQKLCTLLYYYEGLTVKEIAEALECSENTVKSRLNYARKRIKEDVLELERKGTKLYGIAPVPFVVWMVKGTESAYATATNTLYESVFAKLQLGVQTANTVTAEVAVKSAGSVAMATGKGIAAKIAIGVIAASLAIGGAVLGNKYLGNNNEDVNADKTAVATATQEKKKQDISNNEYLEGILLFAPVFDERSPISDEDICLFFDEMLMAEYCCGDAIPSPFAEDEIKDGEKDNMYFTISCNLDSIEKIKNTLGYTGEISEDLWNRVYSVYGSDLEHVDIEGDRFALLIPGMGDYFAKWNIEVLEKLEAKNKTTVYYRIEQDNIATNTNTTHNRVATIELVNGEWIITSVQPSDVWISTQLTAFSEFGQKVLSQKKTVYKDFVAHAENILEEDLREQNDNSGTNYKYKHKFEKMFYIEDPNTDSDYAKSLNVVFRTNKIDSDKNTNETVYYRVEYYNEIHLGGWDAIISEGLKLNSNDVLTLSDVNAPVDVWIQVSEEDYFSEADETLEMRYGDELIGPYIIEFK